MSVQTCVASLLGAGVCCEEDCTETATMATLDERMVEHTRCLRHTVGTLASKPLQWSEEWKP